LQRPAAATSQPELRRCRLRFEIQGLVNGLLGIRLHIPLELVSARRFADLRGGICCAPEPGLLPKLARYHEVTLTGGTKSPFNIPITMKFNEVFKMLCEFAHWGLVIDRGG
jgi:hypothetical protein